MAQFSSSGFAPDELPLNFLKAVPLFPLPNVILFPKAVLPLHIFEERYKMMTADALDGRGVIAMALLRKGWEKDYYSRPAIDPVVCVGQILNHEKLPDGKYNFLLQGVVRAKIIREYRDHSYRTADLERLPDVITSQPDLTAQRARMTSILQADFATFLPGAQQFMQLLAGPLSTQDIADLMAFHLLDDVALKQTLLAECDVVRRVTKIIDTLREMRPPTTNGLPKYPHNPSCN